MNIAINTVCMPELSWAQALAAAKTAGFERIELLAVPGWAHIDPRTTAAQELLDGAEKLYTRVVGIHAGGINGESDAALADTVAYLASAIRLAGKMACERVVFSGFPWPAGLTASQRDAILTRIAGGLTQLAPLAEEHGVTLCLENHYHCQVEVLEDYQAIFARLGVDTPRIGATVDTGHFTSSGGDPAAVVRALGSRVRNVHMKDHIGTESVGLGYGNTDNPSVVQALAAIGYTGDITVELEVHDRPHALRYVREAYPYVETLVAGVVTA